MIALTPAMDAARLLPYKQIGVNVQFDGIPYEYGSHSVAIERSILFGDNNPATGVVLKMGDTNPDTGITYRMGDSVISQATLVRTVRGINGGGSAITPHQGQSSISTIDIPIQRSDELDDMLKRYELKNRRCTIFFGFADVPTGEWVPIFTGLVDDWEMWSEGTGWTFRTVDLQRSQRDEIFRVLITSLNGAITAGQTSITVTDATGFDEILPGYVRISREYLRVTAVNGNVLTVVRGAFGSEPAAAGDGTDVGEVIRLQGDPIEIALAVMTGSYDTITLPDRCHLGISLDDIAIQQWVDARAELGTANELVFILEEPQSGKTFLEREIFKISNLYQTKLGDGRLGVKLFEPPLANTDIRAISNSDTVGLPQVRANKAQIFNRLIWKYNYDPVARTYGPPLIIDDDDSQTAVGRAYPITIESRGLRTNFEDTSGGTVNYGANIRALASSLRLFARYARGPVSISFALQFKHFDIEPGDLVLLSHPNVLNPRTGGYGIPGWVVEILSKAVDIAGGVIRFEAMFTPFAGLRFGKYSDDTLADYGPLAAAAAGGDQVAQGKIDTFGFISQVQGTDSEGTMSNGDPPYRYQ